MNATEEISNTIGELMLIVTNSAQVKNVTKGGLR